MALSNKFGSIVLTTGNKSEMAVGYATLYGDMAGGFAVLKDIAKTLVYRLARYRNDARARDPRAHHHARRRRRSCGPTRPTRTRCRPTRCSTPSSRPTSSRTAARREIVALGFAAADVRRGGAADQARPSTSAASRRSGIRITPRGFGKDWRYPITSAWNDWASLPS